MHLLFFTNTNIILILKTLGGIDMSKNLKRALSITLLIVILSLIYFTIFKISLENDTKETSRQNISSAPTGTIEVIKNFSSPELGNKKTIRIYLPPNYKDSNKSYPVIYMQDGQNLFNKKTAKYNKEWQIDETLDKLYNKKKSDGIIVVGVDSEDSTRTSEYNMFSSYEHIKNLYIKYND